MKLKISLLISILIAVTAAYAGVNYINYNTGEFQCSNGFKDTLSICTPSGLDSTGYAFCQSEVAKICN